MFTHLAMSSYRDYCENSSQSLNYNAINYSHLFLFCLGSFSRDPVGVSAILWMWRETKAINSLNPIRCKISRYRGFSASMCLPVGLKSLRWAFPNWYVFDSRSSTKLSGHKLAAQAKTNWPTPSVILVFLPQFKLVTNEYLQSKYEFAGVIARGAFGIVHRVTDVHEQRQYALKVLSKAQVNFVRTFWSHSNGRPVLQFFVFPDYSRQFGAPIEEWSRHPNHLRPQFVHCKVLVVLADAQTDLSA